MSTVISRIRQFTSKDLQFKIKELMDKFVKSTLANSTLNLSDLRSVGAMSRHIVKYDDERLQFVNAIPNDRQFYYPLEGPGYDGLSFWFMMDHLGTKVKDLSGKGHDGILLGHPTMRRIPIDLGYLQDPTNPGAPAIEFNGGGDSVSATEGEAIQIPDHPDIQTKNKTNGFTFTFTFNSYTFDQHVGPGFNFNRRFLNKRDDADHSVVLAFGTGGDVEFSVFDDNIEYVMDLEALNINQIYRVAARYDPNGGSTSADRISMFLNGTDQSSGSTPGLFIPPTLPNTDMYVASRDQGRAWFQGIIQDLRMYNRALTDTEIANLNTNGLTILPIPKGQVAMVNNYVLQ